MLKELELGRRYDAAALLTAADDRFTLLYIE
jgi:hypothetical protein